MISKKHKNMKNIIYLVTGLLLMSLYYGCKDTLSTDYKNYYQGHEIVYPGAVSGVIVQPGNLAIGLKWKASTDPSIVKYVIYYNNKADSQVVNLGTPKTDSIKTTIRGLAEYTYSFTIYSYDAKGNRSIPFEVNNAKVYGPLYSGGLLNRGYDATTPYVVNANGSVQLNFITPDTINIKTVIFYTNAAGVASTATILPNQTSVTLPTYKSATPITYKSYYIPERTAIDTFAVTNVSTFIQVFTYTKCDKSLFAAVALPFDAYADFGTTMNALWDGTVAPQDYPNVFHTNNNPLPLTFTFDLGKTYNGMARIEETGRISDHNPTDFEVWGTNNITNAAPTVAGTDPTWAAQMTSMGWTLLNDCIRTDNGVILMSFDLIANPPPIRYIRIRVKKNASGQPYANISEITLITRQ
jgi:hypothetical protein